MPDSRGNEEARSFLVRNGTSLALLIAFLLSAVIIFYLEFTLKSQGPNDDKLFRALEFFVSIGIGWTSQSIAAREELHRSLRQYALSAYRRILDIRRSVERMQSALSKAGKTLHEENQPPVGVLGAIIDEMSDTVTSSALDWVDIIGPDLDKLQRIQELQERARYSSQTKSHGDGTGQDESQEALRREIERLLAWTCHTFSNRSQLKQRIFLGKEGTLR